MRFAVQNRVRQQQKHARHAGSKGTEMKSATRCVLYAGAGLMALMTAGAEAGGFYLEERSIKASGRAFAGAAAMADDVTVMSYNAAGMTHLSGTEAAVGGYLVMPRARVGNSGSGMALGPTVGIPVGGQDEGQGFDPQASAYAYLAAPLSQDLWLGLSFTAPFGLKDDYDDDWFGRYDSTKSKVMVMEIAPTIAYRVAPGISVGGSLAIQRANARLVSAIPTPLDPAELDAASDGVFDVKGNDWSLGFSVGLLFEPQSGLRIGVNYRAAVDHRLTGTATTSLMGMEMQQGVAADLNLPDVMSAAIAYEATPMITLLAQVNRYGWDRFREVRLELEDMTEPVSVENFRNTWGVAVGAEVKASDRLNLRGGVEFDETPTVDSHRSTRIPDANRLWASVGASYRLTDSLTVDLSFAHMFKKKVEINRTTIHPFFGSTIETLGRSDTRSNVIGIGFSSAL